MNVSFSLKYYDKNQKQVGQTKNFGPTATNANGVAVFQDNAVPANAVYINISSFTVTDPNNKETYGGPTQYTYVGLFGTQS
jgi:hypothetical protein